MDSLTYLDFELQVERDGDVYKAEVLRSPAGEATSSFTLPFSPEGLENLILKLGARRGRTRGGTSNELGAARELGGALFDAVFTGDVRACLRRSLDAAESAESTGLRLKLRLQSVGELADLPWEFLYDASQGRFLAQSNYTPLVRYVEMPQRIRPLAIDLPLRILVMISAPDDPDYAKLDVAHEKQRVLDALAPLLQSGRVEIDWLEKATLAHLRDALRTQTYHAFHFIGHGGFDPGSEEGLLILEDDMNRGQRAGAHRIGPLLHDHRSLRLAVLNACEGARNSKDDPFSGMATSLIRHGIPAVVAMQFEITDSAAITFAHGFYTAIAEGYPVDMAVAEARSAILVQPNDIEWATPVLYMRAPDGHLFDLSATAPTAPGVLAHPVTEPVDTLAEMEAAPPALSPEPATETPSRETPAESPEPAVEAVPVVALELRLLGRGRLSPSGRYELTLSNRTPGPVDLALQTHLVEAGYASSLPRALLLNGGETRALRFTIAPERRRWRGRRFEVPFTVAAAGGAGEPPATVGGVFEDRPGSFVPYAGGSLMGVGVIAAISLLLFTGGDECSDCDADLSGVAGPLQTMAAGAALTPGATGPTETPGAVVAPTPVAPAGMVQEAIFFSSNRGGGNHDIYSMLADGSQWTRLTDDPANDILPAAPLNAGRLVFVSNRSDEEQIYTMNIDGTDVVRMNDDPFVSLEPDLSPDGKSIAFERRITDTQYEIYILQEDGLILPFSIESDIDPAWAPDGTRIVFGSGRDGNNDIYVMDLDGSNLVKLTDSPANDVEPAWAPDNSKILFESNRDGNPEIYMMNPDGSDQQRLTFDAANDQDPVWSPDSTKIAFETDRDGNWEVYVMDLDSGDLTNLTNHPGEDRKPAWSRIQAP